MKLIYSFIFLTLLQFISNAQYSNGGELFFFNTSAQNVIVRVYPVSGIFNNDNDNYTNLYYGNYNLVMTNRISLPPSKDFINGTSINANLQHDRYFNIPPGYPSNQNAKISFGFDDVGGTDQGSAGTIGFGIWRVEFFWNCTDPEDIYEPPYCLPDDYFTIEYDFGYINNNRNICGAQPADVFIRFTDVNAGHPRIQFLWSTCQCAQNTPYQDIPQNRTLFERERGCSGQTWPKELGNFKYNNGRNPSAPNPYSVMPLDPRYYCSRTFFPQSYGLDYNHFFFNNEIGSIILNLTIEKNITTTVNVWNEQFPNFPPITVTNGATMKIAKGSNNQERTFTFKKYATYNANTSLEVYPNSTLELEGSSNVSERSHMYFESYSNSVIRQIGKLIMGQNSAIDLQGNSFMKFQGNSKIYQNPGSIINIRNTSTLLNCGAQFPVSNGALYALYNNGRYLVSNICPEDFNNSYETLIENGTSFELYDSSNIEIAANCKMIFSGENTYLKAAPGTRITLGTGASIEFRNGAYLDANGCTFTSINSGEIWDGIVLDGAGSQSNIQNCTFNDAATSISVTGTVCNVSGNTFNINNNSSCVYGINAVNESNITISGNTFNAGSNSVAECIRFFNYDGEGIPGGGGSAYLLNIYDNTFNGSLNAVDIQCLTASQLPFYIAYNRFYPANGITSNGIFAYNITGNIKNNVFYNSYSNKSVSLQFSSINMFNNTLYSVNQNIWSSNSTIMQMAPLQNEFGQLIWYGGYNKLNSTDIYNIEFRSYSNPIIIPNGLNCFTVNTLPNFIGELCLGSKPYKAYDNYWYPSVSSSTFNITCNNNPVNVTYTPNLTECPDIDPGNFTGSYVTSLGNSISDTVFISSGGTGGSYPGSEKTIKKTSNTADILYFEAIQKRKLRDYAGAINKCKELINNHDTSSYFNSALSELYLNYLESDTTGNQTITNGLFNNLKTYLEQKMQQYSSNIPFIERAYKYLLMCLVKIQNYSEAIAGYENIMNNHPDPIIRLNASWDRSAVVFMMGSGGSDNELNKASNKLRNKKLLDKNPAHKIAKDVFREQKEESKRIEKNNELYNDDAVNVNIVKYTKEEKAQLERRIENYNPTDKKEFMDKLSSDIKLLEVINTAKTNSKVTGNTPKTYKLLQNYPNPFNPVTNIKYEIPKDANVTIKVYDLLGREVFSITEFKKAGGYEVKFDGSNLASGMYLYSLEVRQAGSSTIGFKDTKKMVLLK